MLRKFPLQGPGRAMSDIQLYRTGTNHFPFSLPWAFLSPETAVREQWSCELGSAKQHTVLGFLMCLQSLLRLCMCIIIIYIFISTTPTLNINLLEPMTQWLIFICLTGLWLLNLNCPLHFFPLYRQQQGKESFFTGTQKLLWVTMFLASVVTLCKFPEPPSLIHTMGVSVATDG